MRLLILLCITLHPLLLLQGYMAGNWYSLFHDYSLGIVFGVVSYSYMVASLLLATRIPLFDRIFGQDKVIKIHSTLSSVAIVLGFVHLLLKQSYISEFTFQTTTGQIAFMMALLIAGVTTLFMVGKSLIPLPGIKKIYQFGKRFPLFDYDKLKRFHNLFALVVILLIVHVFLSSSTQESTVRMVSMALWGAIGVSRYIYFVLRRKFGRKKYTLNTVEQLNDSTYELQLTTSLESLKFKPGQFCYLKVNSEMIKGKEHPFTISSAPEQQLLSFTIKQLGDFTRDLSQFSSHCEVTIDGPYGKFTPECNASPYLFVAAGIGITPFLSILKSWGKNKFSTPVTLLWSVSNEKEFVELEFLKKLQEQQPQFELKLFVTREPDTQYHKGRITESDTLKSYGDREVYLCGPSSFMKSITEKMKGEGVKNSQFHSESFSS